MHYRANLQILSSIVLVSSYVTGSHDDYVNAADHTKLNVHTHGEVPSSVMFL
jgi:hypothetical protein